MPKDWILAIHPNSQFSQQVIVMIPPVDSHGTNRCGVVFIYSPLDQIVYNIPRISHTTGSSTTSTPCTAPRSGSKSTPPAKYFPSTNTAPRKKISTCYRAPKEHLLRGLFRCRRKKTESWPSLRFEYPFHEKTMTFDHLVIGRNRLN